MNNKLVPVLAAMCVMLAGCGGGGGGGSSNPPPNNGNSGLVPSGTPDGALQPSSPTRSATLTAPEIPIEAAVTKLYTTSQVYRDRTSANVTREFRVLGPATFENKTVQSVEIINTGANGSSLRQTDYFLTQPFRLIGRKFSDDVGSARTVTFAKRQLPLSARPGDADFFFESATYAADGSTTFISRSTWEVTLDANEEPNIATFCVLPSNTFAVGTPAIAGVSDCYKINTTGDVVAVKFIAQR